MNDLASIGKRMGTDKVAHGYCPLYENHLGHLRDREFTLVEIGVAWGASLRMWEEYFPKARVVGIDRGSGALAFQNQRTRIFVGDQGDPEFLRRVVQAVGGFDVVIDDGSHLMVPQQTTFREFIPHLRPGGLYVIEDIETCYWPRAGGGPPMSLESSGSTIELFKHLIDQLTPWAHSVPTPLPFPLAEMHFYPDIMFLRRSS